MRIISGCRRGHKLHEFLGEDIRPTTDRVKESLFNLIFEFIGPEAHVLDLFGGSGALGFEAASRGCKKTFIVDKAQASIDVIKQNLSELRLEDRVEVVHSDAFEFLQRTQERFDIIFLDPPYNKGFVLPIVKSIFSNEVLSQGGIIVIETDSTDLPEGLPEVELIKQRKYGRTYVSIFCRR